MTTRNEPAGGIVGYLLILAIFTAFLAAALL